MKKVEKVSFYDYLIGCVEPYDETKQNKALFIRDCVLLEKSYDVEKYGFRNAFISWCCGLPSVFNLPFLPEDIKKACISFNLLLTEDMATFYGLVYKELYHMIKFKHVDVIFKDPIYNYSTSVNLLQSDEQIRNYFIGTSFNLGFESDNLQKCINVKIC